MKKARFLLLIACILTLAVVTTVTITASNSDNVYYEIYTADPSTGADPAYTSTSPELYTELKSKLDSGDVWVVLHKDATLTLPNRYQYTNDLHIDLGGNMLAMLSTNAICGLAPEGDGTVTKISNGTLTTAGSKALFPSTSNSIDVTFENVTIDLTADFADFRAGGSLTFDGCTVNMKSSVTAVNNFLSFGQYKGTTTPSLPDGISLTVKDTVFNVHPTFGFHSSNGTIFSFSNEQSNKTTANITGCTFNTVGAGLTRLFVNGSLGYVDLTISDTRIFADKQIMYSAMSASAQTVLTFGEGVEVSKTSLDQMNLNGATFNKPNNAVLVGIGNGTVEYVDSAKTVTVKYYDGSRLISSVLAKVGAAPYNGGDCYHYDKGFSVSTPGAYYSDSAMTQPLDKITASTVNIYCKATVAGTKPVYAVFSGEPSLATLVSYSTSSTEIYSDSIAASTRVIEAYSNINLTVPKAVAPLTHDLTVQLNGNKLSLTATTGNYAFNPSSGTTFAIKNGVLESTNAQIAFVNQTTPNLVYEDLVVNFSGAVLIDHRGGGTIQAKNTTFNFTAKQSRAFYLLTKADNYTLDCTFVDCNFYAPSTTILDAGLFHTGSPSYATSTLNLTIAGCTFDIANTTQPMFQQVSEANLNVTVKSSDTRDTAFKYNSVLMKATASAKASINIGDGTRFGYLPADSHFVNVTPTYAVGCQMVPAKGDYVYAYTSDVISVNKVKDGTTQVEYYENGYSTTLGYETENYVLDTLNGVKGARRIVSGWFDSDGKLITEFAPYDGMTISYHSGPSDEWADWVIFNAGETEIIDCAFNPEYDRLYLLPDTWTTMIPAGGVARFFSNVTTNVNLASFNNGVTIDLNGNKLIFKNGRFLCNTNNGDLTVKNGSVDTAATSGTNILMTANGYKGTVIFENVELVNLNGTVFDYRGGTMYLNNCTYNGSSNVFLALGARYTENCPIRVYVNGCNINANTIITLNGYAGTTYSPDAFVEFNNSEIFATTLYRSNSGIGTDAKSALRIVNSKVKAETMYNVGIDYAFTVYIEESLFSTNPTECASAYTPDEIAIKAGQNVIKNKSREYPWAVTVPVSLSWNIAFHTGVRVNFFLDKQGIDYIIVNGVQYDVSNLASYDDETYLIPLDVVPANRAMETINIRVGYGGGYYIDKSCTLVDYANSVFNSNNTHKTKQLVAATMAYINAAYEYARTIDENAPATPEVLTNLLSDETYLKYTTDKKVTWDGVCDIGNSSVAIKSAQLDLGSDLNFRFNLVPGYNGTLVLGETAYTIIKGTDASTGLDYINYNIRSHSLYQDDIAISGVSDGGVSFSGTYCLSTYINNIKDTASAETMHLMDALGVYVFMSYEYLIEKNELDGYTPSAEIVNKGGASAAVTYVIDDGGVDTGKTAKTFLEKYDYLRLSFGIYTQKFTTAALATTTNENGELVYLMENGKYVYNLNTAYYEIWKDIMSLGRSEIISHSHTHAYWGQDDEGGVTYYVDNSGNIRQSVEMPKGSSTKEFYAPLQILAELFPASEYPLMRLLTFIIPGISVPMSDVTVNGVKYPSYYNYFSQIMHDAVDKGLLIGARNTFQVNNTTDSRNQVVLPSYMANPEYRLKTPGYMIVNGNKGANGIENWTAYIDHAIEQGGWACFCIHEIRNDAAGHYILVDDADALFGYVKDKNVWVATYTEAMLYYSEWSTAKVSSEYRDGKIYVTLTDGERDDVYDMALTVKVSVPDSWNTVEYNDELIEVLENEDGTRYVYVDVVPDRGEVEISKVD